jgi:hypothetical protein
MVHFCYLGQLCVDGVIVCTAFFSKICVLFAVYKRVIFPISFADETIVYIENSMETLKNKTCLE